MAKIPLEKVRVKNGVQTPGSIGPTLTYQECVMVLNEDTGLVHFTPFEGGKKMKKFWMHCSNFDFASDLDQSKFQSVKEPSKHS